METKPAGVGSSPSEDDGKVTRPTASVYTADQWNALSAIDKGGGGGNDGGMEARIAKLEAHVEHIQKDISDIKTDVREIRSSVVQNFLITWGGIITAALGLAALMAKGFKWL